MKSEEGRAEGKGRRLQQLEKSLALCERDRALIAFELHDGLVQQLAAASMHVDAAAAHLPSQPGEAQAMLRTAAERLRTAMEEARRLMRGIRPPGLESHGLADAIQQLADELKAGGLELDLKLEMSTPRLLPTLETTAFRILQEALHNVQRHSGASKAEVVVREHQHYLEIIVRDTGRGFDPQSVPNSRYGLRGIRERALLLGGIANIDSRPGTGTVISVQLPLRDVLLEPTNEQSV